MLGGEKIRVLLADDEDHIRLYLSQVLPRINCEVVAAASNGRECVELYRRHAPDLVLLDINMPAMSGVDALKAIRSEHPEALVIMLTSLHAAAIVRECLDAGARHYIRKDTPLADLRQRIATVWAARHTKGGQ